MNEDGSGLGKAFWRAGRKESQVEIHQRHKKVIMGLWGWHLQLWGKKKVLQPSARTDMMLRLGGWQWYSCSKGTMWSGGFEPHRKPHDKLASPRLEQQENSLREVLKENWILDEKKKEWRRAQADEERQDLIPVSHVAQMANPCTCCCYPASLHDSNQIQTQPTDIFYSALTCFQKYALIMSAASQSILVITASPSAIPTPENYPHTHLM